MDIHPPQSQAHLIVAAVRVLAHKSGRPPSVDEMAELLGWSRELCGHLVRALEAHGITRTLKSPFEVRVEIDDHHKIDALPVEETGPRLQDEVEEFHTRFQKKQEELQNLFDSGEMDKKKKQRFAGLDDELSSFKAPKWNPWGESPKPEPDREPDPTDPEASR